MTEERFQELVRWYQDAKPQFSVDTYVRKGSEWSRIFRPYTDWDSSETLRREIAFNLKAQAKLQEHLADIAISEQRSGLALLILALKNRAEYVSNQADFYPVYVALIIFANTLIGFGFSDFWNILMGVGIFVLVAASVKTRVSTRTQVAHLKEIVNLLESYEKTYFKARPTA
jgi:hypothetical protein